VCAALAREFADRLDVEVIERIAAEEVAALEGARVEDFIPVLAMRRGRLRLRDGAPPDGGDLGDLEEVEGESRLVAGVQERDRVLQGRSA
jgi:hypothetical protein